MAKRLLSIKNKISHFFSPDNRPATRWLRWLPYLSLFLLGAVLFAVAGAGWEYANTSEFCGTSCHTMPPEYQSYLASPHARVNCVECHIGRGFIATQFTRKAGDISHVFKYIGACYEVPIYAKRMRPASEVCEKCHSPQSFSDDSLREYKHYDAANNNALNVTYLSFKTGGGTFREGRGKGIHWHIENKVEFISTDEPQLAQDIPWVRITYADTGESSEYIDTEANLPADFAVQNQSKIVTMDCMTCHNRIAHEFPNPSAALDDAMARGVVSPDIPFIKQNAIAVMDRQYPSMEEATNAVEGLRDYYATNYSDFYSNNTAMVDSSVDELVAMYQRMVFPTMDVTWDTHANNLGHKDSAGCFRCHDGNHLNSNDEPVRLECNLCHSIPLISAPDGSIASLPVAEEFEPESHADSHWIARHRFDFDDTCEGCHTVTDPGGVTNQSFCGNSGCHATEWKYLNITSPEVMALSNVLTLQDPAAATAPLTWDGRISAVLEARCVVCHGDAGGLNLETYASAMLGGDTGAAIIPGNAEESLLIQVQQKHPNQLPVEAAQWLTDWINNGAPEK